MIHRQGGGGAPGGGRALLPHRRAGDGRAGGQADERAARARPARARDHEPRDAAPGARDGEAGGRRAAPGRRDGDRLAGRRAPVARQRARSADEGRGGGSRAAPLAARQVQGPRGGPARPSLQERGVRSRRTGHLSSHPASGGSIQPTGRSILRFPGSNDNNRLIRFSSCRT